MPGRFKSPSDEYDAEYGVATPPPEPGERVSSWTQKRIDRNFDQVQKVVAQRRPAIAANDFDVEDILSTGRFLTQHETQKSNGMYDPYYRANHEHEYHGYPNRYPGWSGGSGGEDDEPSASYSETGEAGDHPTYGYMRPGRNSRVMDPIERSDVVDQYGNAVFNLDPDRVLHHTTVTMGDSLGADYTPETAHAVITGQGLHNKATFTAQGRPPDQYVEAQFHRPVRTSDVDSVDLYRVTRFGYRDDPRMSLRDADIPYRSHTHLGETTQGAMISVVGGRETPVNFSGSGAGTHEGQIASRAVYSRQPTTVHYRVDEEFHPRSNYGPDPNTGMMDPQPRKLRPLSGTREFWTGMADPDEDES